MQKNRIKKSVVVDHLEARRLLSYAAYVQISSPLETGSTNAITVAANQPVTFNVSVEGYQIGGGDGPTPTGTVNIFETNVAGTVDRYAVLTLSGAGTTATASGTLVMASPGNIPNSDYQPFVYADYLGDANYDETTSAGSPPSNDGNVGNTVTVDFTQTSQCAFIQQPSNTAAGDTIKPPITVAVEDSSGNYQTGSTDSITLSLAGGSTGAGTLSGTTTVSAVGGIATFSNLSINDGGDYVLTATDSSNSSVSSATSSSFTITGGKLVFKTPPKGTQTAGSPLAPAIQVELKDGKGKLITSEDGTQVTLAPIGTTADNPITGNTATLSDGVATFSNLVLTKPGFYQLQATDGGDTQATTAKFKVAGDKLVFLKPPTPTDVNTPIVTTVELLKANGQRDTDATSSLALSLNVIQGKSNAALAGTAILQFSAGLASFSGANAPTIDLGGTYTLTATEEDTSLGSLAPTQTTAPITSGKFKIAGVTLQAITAIIGSQKAASSDDDLTITDSNVVAVPASSDTMQLIATQLKPTTDPILAGIGWTVIRNTADIETGALPTLIKDDTDPLEATITLNSPGSYNVVCYYDANSNGVYDAGEELKVFHLAIVGITLNSTFSPTTNNAYFHAVVTGGSTTLSSGNLAANQDAILLQQSVQVVGGGADGMIGLDQIHLGYLQNGTADTAAVTYKSGQTLDEHLFGATFPILDSTYPPNSKSPYAIFTVPPGTTVKSGTAGPMRDPVIGSDPAGGQDREVDTADSPALFFTNTHFGSPATAATGANNFSTYLSAYSDSFNKDFIGYTQTDWATTFNFSQSILGNWQQNDSSTDISRSIAFSVGTDLSSLGAVTTGKTYLQTVEL